MTSTTNVVYIHYVAVTDISEFTYEDTLKYPTDNKQQKFSGRWESVLGNGTCINGMLFVL